MHHGAGLRRLLKDEAQVAALVDDFRSAPLSPSQHAMLEYAVKLTRAPWQVGHRDIERLRSLGFSDAAILDICQVTAYYAFANRLVDGLGVELEDHWQAG